MLKREIFSMRLLKLSLKELLVLCKSNRDKFQYVERMSRRECGNIIVLAEISGQCR